jgi:hypothetical protein
LRREHADDEHRAREQAGSLLESPALRAAARSAMVAGSISAKAAKERQEAVAAQIEFGQGIGATCHQAPGAAHRARDIIGSKPHGRPSNDPP